MSLSKKTNTKDKKLSSRQKEIIQMLTKATINKPITVSQIAEKLSLSSRTVLREMPKIEAWLEENEFKFIKKPGLGLLIDENLQNQRLILELLEVENIEKDYSKGDRRRLIIGELLTSKEPLKLFYFTSFLKVSEGTLSNDLDGIEEWLRSFNIKLIRKPGLGIYLEGRERDYRKALVNILYDSLEEKEIMKLLKGSLMISRNDEIVEFSIENRLLKFIDKAIIKSMEEIISNLEKEMSLKLADSAYIGLVVHLSLAIQRIQNNESIKMDKEVFNELSALPEFEMGEKIVSKIEEKFDINIPRDEIGYITMHLKGAKLRLNSISDLEADIEKLDVKHIANHIIKMAEDEFNIDLKYNGRLLANLTNHLVPAISRLKMKLNIRNPLLSNIKEQYPKEFEVTARACDLLKNQINVNEIPESEVAYITMHIAAALEKRVLEDKLRILISCPTGVGTSSLLSSTIQKEFTGVEVVGTVSAMNIDEDALNERSIDLIVSTVPVDTKFKNICVNPILSSQDKILLKDYFRRILNNKKYEGVIKKNTQKVNRISIREITDMGNEIISIIDNVRLKEAENISDLDEIAAEASKMFYDNEETNEELKQKFLERERISSTYLEELKILLLHCRYNKFHNGRFGYIRFNNNIKINEKVVKGSIVSVIPEKCKNIITECLSEINSALIEKEEFVEVLNEGTEYNIKIEVEKLLKSFYKRRIKSNMEELNND